MCFRGHNVLDPDHEGCRNSAWVFIIYIFINFVYNFLLLIITKRGSAVLLVISQALSLPITNIAFSIPAVMGDDVEPLTLPDLVGLVLVCIGFLLYSGFGFAENFIVAQGPPGQMTFASVNTGNALMVSKEIITEPRRLAAFLTRLASHKNWEHRARALSDSFRVEDDSAITEGEKKRLLDSPSASSEVVKSDPKLAPSGRDTLLGKNMEEVNACRLAIDTSQKTTELLKERLKSLSKAM